MKKVIKLFVLTLVFVIVTHIQIPIVQSEQALFLAYPPNNHKTSAEKIFLIGTASSEGEVLINNQPVQRSKAGHFAPSFPLIIGDNLFEIRYKSQEVKVNVTRITNVPSIPTKLGFAEGSLTPSQNITRLKGELICFSAIATPNAIVSVKVGEKIIPLLSQSEPVKIPNNADVLTDNNQAVKIQNIDYYQGCDKFLEVEKLGFPLFKITHNNQTITQQSIGEIEIILSQNLPVIEIISDAGITRTGPGTDYSRLTPLPKGTQASVTGKEGDWLRLDYGAWILANETRLLPNKVLSNSIIRGVSSRQLKDATEIIFPLQNPVPMSIKQEDEKFILTLYNTVAQTDTIYLSDNPLVKRLDWQQVTPNQIDYIFYLKSSQQWGYSLRYEGTNLILTLRYPPQKSQALQGVTILLDAGHGGQETGSKGPNGYPEKAVNLVVSKLLKQKLMKRGATVYMTREDDRDVSLPERVKMINDIKPTLSLSIHYNALPDDGDAIKTSGIGIFWYHPQAHNLSVFLHDYLVKNLNRSSYGVFWNNLALTRPNISPSILLELGFMINPEEFEWIVNSQEQEKLAQTIAYGLVAWFENLE